jgi:hypothetical protein
MLKCDDLRQPPATVKGKNRYCCDTTQPIQNDVVCFFCERSGSVKSVTEFSCGPINIAVSNATRPFIISVHRNDYADVAVKGPPPTRPAPWRVVVRQRKGHRLGWGSNVGPDIAHINPPRHAPGDSGFSPSLWAEVHHPPL